MLGREGWIVDVAEDGARALQMTRQLRYDLVVTDLEMPELGGFELIQHLRKDERFNPTPSVIIRPRGAREHRRRGRDLGVRPLVASRSRAASCSRHSQRAEQRELAGGHGPATAAANSRTRRRARFCELRAIA